MNLSSLIDDNNLANLPVMFQTISTFLWQIGGYKQNDRWM